MDSNYFKQHFINGQYFNKGPAGPKACEIKHIFVALTAATANQTVIAAVTGKEIHVLEGNLAAVGAAGAITLKNNTTNIKGYNVPANTSATPNVPILGYEYPVMKTGTGLALMADTAGGSVIWVSLTYIEVES